MPLEVVTPMGVVYSAEVFGFSVQAWDGSLGVRPRHAPLVTALADRGTLTIRDGSGRHRLSVEGGFLRVMPSGATGDGGPQHPDQRLG